MGFELAELAAGAGSWEVRGGGGGQQGRWYGVGHQTEPRRKPGVYAEWCAIHTAGRRKQNTRSWQLATGSQFSVISVAKNELRCFEPRQVLS
jgi:hypothetical protein